MCVCATLRTGPMFLFFVHMLLVPFVARSAPFVATVATPGIAAGRLDRWSNLARRHGLDRFGGSNRAIPWKNSVPTPGRD